MMGVPNEELEQLIKKLNDKNKETAKSFLMWLLESQLSDDEDTLTPSDIQAIERARKDLKNGETTSLENLKREFDL